jgi:aminoglycoside 6'-N-acetyltransferase
MHKTLHGERVSLRIATRDDIPRLAEIRATPEVYRWWRGEGDMASEVAVDLEDADAETMVVEVDGRVVGAIQWSAENEPDYRHASMDIYLDPAVHGRGLGSDAVRTLARHLVREVGFHRLVIDPAADNAAAIACYAKVGFRPVGIMRRYERGSDGTWHDGLLMDLLAEELAG